MPLPPEDESSFDIFDCPPLRWGILGCGRISHDFSQALKLVPSATIKAAAARDASAAKAFAEKHGIDRSYGSYDDLLLDEEIDIIYVGNPHPFRRAIGEKVLFANKHVLLEKPFACNAEDAKYLISLAKQRNLFLMEGMWTKFFPAVEKARQLVFGTDSSPGVIGDVVSVQSDFHFDSSDSETYPTSQAYNRKLGGGASFHLAPYTIAAATTFFGEAPPTQVKAVGFVDDVTGVDLQGALSLSFPSAAETFLNEDEKKDDVSPSPAVKGVASLSFGFLGESAEETVIIGTKGRIIIRSPAHCPTTISVKVKGNGRGEVAMAKEYHYPLPSETEEISRAGGFFYPNSAGFAYEAAAVARCIGAGETEAYQHTLRHTLNNIEILDELRGQMGLGSV